MIPKSVIHVPRTAWTDIDRLLAVPLGQLKALAEYIIQSSPTSDIEDLAESCASTLSIDVDIAESILTVAINLNLLRRSLDVEPHELLDQFTNTLAATFDGWDEPKRKEFDKRRDVFTQLIVPNGTIEIMSKARELLFEAQCRLLDTTVITDTRHVFNDSATKSLGGLVIHTLGLEYLEGTQHRELHVTLSPQGVDDLIKQLRRAKKKEQVAQDLLTNQKLPLLTPRKESSADDTL
jgi:hypothetical protein